MGSGPSYIPPWMSVNAPERPTAKYDEWGYVPDGLIYPTQHASSTYFNTDYGGAVAMLPSPNFDPVTKQGKPGLLGPVTQIFGAQTLSAYNGQQWPSNADGGNKSDLTTPVYNTVIRQPTMEKWDKDATVCQINNFPFADVQHGVPCTMQPIRDEAAVVTLFNGREVNAMDATAQAITDGYEKAFVNGGFESLKEVNTDDTSGYDPCDNPGFFEVLFPLGFGVAMFVVYERFMSPALGFTGVNQAMAQIGMFGFGYNYAVASMRYWEPTPDGLPVGEKYTTCAQFLIYPSLGIGGMALGEQLYNSVQTDLPVQLFQGVSIFVLHELFSGMIPGLAKAISRATFGGGFIIGTVSLVMKGVSKLFCWMGQDTYEACRDKGVYPKGRRWDVLSIAGKLTEEACEREGWERSDPRAEFVFRALVTGPFMMRMAQNAPGDIDIFGKNRTSMVGSIYEPVWQTFWSQHVPFGGGKPDVTYDIQKVAGWDGDIGPYANEMTSNMFACQNWDVLRNAQQEVKPGPEAELVKNQFDRWIGTWDERGTNYIGTLIQKARDPANINAMKLIPGLHSNKSNFPLEPVPGAGVCEAAAATALEYALGSAFGALSRALEFIEAQNPMCYEKPWMPGRQPVKPWIVLRIVRMFAMAATGATSTDSNGVWGQVLKMIAEGTVPDTNVVHYSAAMTWNKMVTESPEWIAYAKAQGYTLRPQYEEQVKLCISQGDGDEPPPPPPGDPEPIKGGGNALPWEGVLAEADTLAYADGSGLVAAYDYLTKQDPHYTQAPWHILQLPLDAWIQLRMIFVFSAVMAGQNSNDENAIWDQFSELMGFFLLDPHVRYTFANAWYQMVFANKDWQQHATATKQAPRADIVTKVQEWLNDPASVPVKHGDPNNPDPLYPIDHIGKYKGTPIGDSHWTHGKSNAAYIYARNLAYDTGKLGACYDYIIKLPQQFYTIPFDHIYVNEPTWLSFFVLYWFAAGYTGNWPAASADNVWLKILKHIREGDFPDTTASRYALAEQWWQMAMASPDWLQWQATNRQSVNPQYSGQAYAWIQAGGEHQLPGPGTDPSQPIDPQYPGGFDPIMRQDPGGWDPVVPTWPAAPTQPVVGPSSPIYREDPGGFKPVEPSWPSKSTQPIVGPSSPIYKQDPSGFHPVDPSWPSQPTQPIVGPSSPIYKEDPSGFHPVDPTWPSAPTQPVTGPSTPLKRQDPGGWKPVQPTWPSEPLKAPPHSVSTPIGLQPVTSTHPTQPSPYNASLASFAHAWQLTFTQNQMNNLSEFIKSQPLDFYYPPFNSANAMPQTFIAYMTLFAFASVYNTGDHGGTNQIDAVWSAMMNALSANVVPTTQATQYAIAETWFQVVNASPDWQVYANTYGWKPDPTIAATAYSWIKAGP